jgi:hypothetical protein
MGIALLFGLIGLISADNTDSGRDTLYYSGFIAIEMVNVMQNTPGPAIDNIDVYNETNCHGFVLFDKRISKKNYEESFFPLGLCDAKMGIGDISTNNNRFYDTIFSSVTRIGTRYKKKIKVKTDGHLSLNYKIIKVRITYVVTGKSVLRKYIMEKINSDADLNVESNICKIITLRVESP